MAGSINGSSSNGSIARPKLRSIDIRPHSHQGEAYLMLRDPLLLSDRLLLLPQAMGLVLAHCDGTLTPDEMTGEISRYLGSAVPGEIITRVIHALDESCLLENDRSAAALEQARRLFRQAPYRVSRMAGQGYPADPDGLHALIEGYLESARHSRNGTGTNSSAGLVGLLSPHIDYPRGGPVYAQVWDRAAEAVQAAELVVIFGTDHYGADPFSLTRQHYATPYGVLPTAVEIVDRLAAVIDAELGAGAAFAGELRHRGEHSLELVTVWLHHMRRRAAVEVVPILVGGFHHFIHNGASPAQDPLLGHVLATLAEACAGRRVLVVASGDLAHVGPAFGGQPLNQKARAAVAAADDDLMHQMRAGDAEGFFESIRQVRDGNNVCGVAPIYLTMQLGARLAGPLTGNAAGYASCPADESNTSAVTVGGMVFYASGS